MANDLMTKDFANELVNYDPETGVFTWKTRPLSHFKKPRDWKIWNTKHSGSVIKNPDNSGYLYMNLSGRRYPLHRMAILISGGEYYGLLVDHKNGCVSDNRISNLRVSSKTENNRNQRIKKSNSSGFKGVHFSKQKGKWTSAIRTSGKRINLGFFCNKEDAARAYDTAAIKYHGEYARTNKQLGVIK